MRRFRHPLILAILVACATVLAAVLLSPRWAERSLAESLRREIDSSVDEAPAVAAVERLAVLDDAAIPHLVALLDDDRQVVRAAARESLRRDFAEWSKYPSAASDRRAALLAAELAAMEPPRDLYNRVFVKLTAIKLLRWKSTSEMSDPVMFLADCSTILERTADAATSEEEAPAPFFEGKETELTAPTASLPPVVDAIPFEPVSVAPKPVGVIDENTPELLPRGDEEPLPPSRLQPQAPRRIRSTEAMPPEAQQTSAIDHEAIESLPTRSLMRHLHGIAAIATAAEEELRRRGFNDQALVTARALDDPDPKVRLKLAESIGSLRGIEATSWLWELANDDDQDVRRAALDVLATSNNPETRRRVAERRR